MSHPIPIRDAEIVDCNGYKLPERRVDGHVMTRTHRTEERARKAAAKDGQIAFILRWQSEVGNYVYGLLITDATYYERRATAKR